MKIHYNNWKEHDYWSLKELILLLFLEFVVVLGIIKVFVQPLYIEWLQNDLYAGTLLGLTIAIILILGVYYFALRPKHLTWAEVGLRKFNNKDWKLIILYTIVVLIGAIVITLLTSLVGNTWENSKTEAIQNSVTFTSFIIAFISAAVISPLYEEIFYRGFLYRWFRTRIGFVGALIISSSIFTIVHIPTYNAMPVNFFSGIVFALAYEKTNSIWPAIFIHGISNGIMVILASTG